MNNIESNIYRKLSELERHQEPNKEKFILDEDFTLEEEYFRTLRMKYPSSNTYSTISKDNHNNTKNQPINHSNILFDQESLQEQFHQIADPKILSDSESEDEEVLLEWDFDENFTAENHEKINNSRSFFSISSQAMSSLEENLNKPEIMSFSEFNKRSIDLTFSNKNQKTSEEKNELTAEKIQAECLSSNKPTELEVTVSTNNNEHKNNKEVLAEVLSRIEKIKDKSNKPIPPYSEIYFNDPNLVDYYLIDFVVMNKKKKKTMTGKPLEDSTHIPPLPSEILEHFRKGKKNFILKFHHNTLPFKIDNKNFGYGFSVKCEKIKIDQYYTVNDRVQLPSCKLREYLSQAILMLLYPNAKKWVDLLKLLNYKI